MSSILGIINILEARWGLSTFICIDVNSKYNVNHVKKWVSDVTVFLSEAQRFSGIV